MTKAANIINCPEQSKCLAALFLSFLLTRLCLLFSLHKTKWYTWGIQVVKLLPAIVPRMTQVVLINVNHIKYHLVFVDNIRSKEFYHGMHNIYGTQEIFRMRVVDMSPNHFFLMQFIFKVLWKCSVYGSPSVNYLFGVHQLFDWTRNIEAPFECFYG